MNGEYFVKAKCLDCHFIRKRCGIRNNHFTDKNGFAITKHLARTDHEVKLTSGNIKKICKYSVGYVVMIDVGD